MDQEKQLQEILELSRENNHLLKGVHSRARWGMFFWILRWAIVVGILFGAYYYVEPYVEKATDTYQKTTETIKHLQSGADKVTNNGAIQMIFGNGTSTASTTNGTSKQDSILDALLKVLGI